MNTITPPDGRPRQIVEDAVKGRDVGDVLHQQTQLICVEEEVAALRDRERWW
jgi:hypothetical protein